MSGATKCGHRAKPITQFGFMMADADSTITMRRSRPSSCKLVMLIFGVSVCWRRAAVQALVNLCPADTSVACGPSFKLANTCNCPTDSTNFSERPFVLVSNNDSDLSQGWWVGEKKNCRDLSPLFFYLEPIW